MGSCDDVNGCPFFYTVQHILMMSIFIYAGLFDDHSRLLGSAGSPIQIWKDGDCIEVMGTWYLWVLFLLSLLGSGR